MKKLVLFIAMFVFTISAFSQTILKVKDSVFVISTEQINSANGARTINISDYADSLGIIDMFYNLLDAKYKAYLSDSYTKEIRNLDSIFYKFSGYSYVDMTKYKIRKLLQGNFNIKCIDDSTFNDSITIKETIVYKKGSPIGSVEINSIESFTINGVLKDGLVFILRPRTGAIATLKNKRYILKS